MNKKCTKCKEIKDTSMFQRHERYADGFLSWCKVCKLNSQRKHPETNRKWNAANKERSNEIKKHYSDNNKDKVRDSKSKWYKANPKRQLALTRKYQAAKLNATPSWLTSEQKEEIVQIYENCPEGFEVDHVEPLQGKDIRGLHVPWNLQILPKGVNRRKSNKRAA